MARKPTQLLRKPSLTGNEIVRVYDPGENWAATTQEIADLGGGGGSEGTYVNNHDGPIVLAAGSLILTADDRGKMYCADGDQLDLHLPNAGEAPSNIRVDYEFTVSFATQIIKIIPGESEVISVRGTNTALGGDGGFVQSNQEGSYLRIMVVGNRWEVVSAFGMWIFDTGGGNFSFIDIGAPQAF